MKPRCVEANLTPCVEGRVDDLTQWHCVRKENWDICHNKPYQTKSVRDVDLFCFKQYFSFAEMTPGIDVEH